MVSNKDVINNFSSLCFRNFYLLFRDLFIFNPICDWLFAFSWIGIMKPKKFFKKLFTVPSSGIVKCHSANSDSLRKTLFTIIQLSLLGPKTRTWRSVWIYLSVVAFQAAWQKRQSLIWLKTESSEKISPCLLFPLLSFHNSLFTNTAKVLFHDFCVGKWIIMFYGWNKLYILITSYKHWSHFVDFEIRTG